MATACIFQPSLLEINVSDEPSNMIRKKRRIQQPQSGSFFRDIKRQPQFSFRKINQSYIISLRKEITSQLITELLQKKISRLWGKIHIPSYELITDNHGNQVYVEQGVDEDKLTSEIMKRLNPNLVDLEATQILFDDYHLELSHTGNGISVFSSNDCFHKEFSFNNETNGKFRICGTSVSADSLGRIYGFMLIEIPLEGNGFQDDCTFNKISALSAQTEAQNDLEQEIRTFNISQAIQERIIKKEVARRLKEQGAR